MTFAKGWALVAIAHAATMDTAKFYRVSPEIAAIMIRALWKNVTARTLAPDDPLREIIAGC